MESNRIWPRFVNAASLFQEEMAFSDHSVLVYDYYFMKDETDESEVL